MTTMIEAPAATGPSPKNRISVRKLLSSKWTAVAPRDREKHFMVVCVIEPESPGLPVERVALEAVHSRRTFLLPWRDLQDATQWRQGWL